MGYSTEFSGHFNIEKPLTPEHCAYLARFAKIRHMRWLEEQVSCLPDPIRVAVGLPAGPEGMYLTNDLVMEESYGHHYPHHAAIIDYNREPAGVPGLWLQWVPTEDGAALVWDGGEKFYDYVHWLEFLLKHFLIPWGYALTGRIEWQGDDPDDRGVIVVEQNKVTIEEKMNSERTIPDPERDPEAWRAHWQEQIKTAQEQLVYEIEGERYARIPYGQESSDVPPCHDCDVAPGQYHVPGCDSEMCPKCGRRAIACECAYFPGDSEIYSEEQQR